jgi:acyl-CoA-dependent ceramide synthase
LLCHKTFADLSPKLAKILKYLEYQTACDVAFGIFMITWFLSRHIFYLTVVYSIYHDLPETIKYGCYQGSNANLQGPFEPPNDFSHLTMPFRDPEGLVCYYNVTNGMFLTLLLSLQVILLIWFGMILRVAWKILQGGGAEDSRSDDDGEEEEDEEEVLTLAIKTQNDLYTEALPLEEEVGVEGINFSSLKPISARRYKRGTGGSSGVSLGSDRKELLGRIGCERTHD